MFSHTEGKAKNTDLRELNSKSSRSQLHNKPFPVTSAIIVLLNGNWSDLLYWAKGEYLAQYELACRPEGTEIREVMWWTWSFVSAVSSDCLSYCRDVPWGQRGGAVTQPGDSWGKLLLRCSANWGSIWNSELADEQWSTNWHLYPIFPQTKSVEI